MPLVKAQCTNCGAPLEVDDSKEAAICPHCNTPYIVEKAINNYTTNITNNIQAQNVTIVGGKDFNQLFNSAKALLAVSHKQGLEACNEALSLQPTNYEVWALLAKYYANDTGKEEITAIKKVIELTPDDRIEEVSKDVLSYLIDFREKTCLTFMDKVELANDYLALTQLSPEYSVMSATRIMNLLLSNANHFSYFKEMQDAYAKVQERRKNDYLKCDAEFRSSFSLEEKPIQPSVQQSAPSRSSGGCYIATAVYGSYDCPQVWTLRRYRDYTLAETWYGRAFIHTYYAISPTLVKWFGNTDWFKNLWQPKLDRMVERLNAEGVENTPYADRDW